MNPWLALASPFLLGALIIGTIKACEAWGKYRERRDMRVRDAKLNRFSMGAIRGAKDWWIS